MNGGDDKVERGLQGYSGKWASALVHSLPVAAGVLALLYYWFAVADRYVVFLYYHDMGPLYPDTSPFSAVTSGRYWMAGLVVGGSVMLLYIGANWLFGRLLRTYDPPFWWQVWAVSCPPLLAGVPLITMTVNVPTLPFGRALQVTSATLIGVGLALIPGRMAARHPGRLVLLFLEGGAMAAILLGVSFLERVPWPLDSGIPWPLSVIVVGMLGAVGLLLATTGLRIRRRMAVPSAWTLFAAGLWVAYLLLPLAHYLVGSDGYFYISDKDNFFARSWILQMVAWSVAGAVAMGVTRLRRNVSFGTQSPALF